MERDDQERTELRAICDTLVNVYDHEHRPLAVYAKAQFEELPAEVARRLGR